MGDDISSRYGPVIIFMPKSKEGHTNGSIFPHYKGPRPRWVLLGKIKFPDTLCQEDYQHATNIKGG